MSELCEAPMGTSSIPIGHALLRHPLDSHHKNGRMLIAGNQDLFPIPSSSRITICWWVPTRKGRHWELSGSFLVATRRVPLVPNKKKVIAAGHEASTENARNSHEGRVDSCQIFCGCCGCHLQWVVEYSMVGFCLAFPYIPITMPWNTQQCNEGFTVCLVVGSHQRIPNRPRSNDTAHRPWMETWAVMRVVWEGTWFDRAVVVSSTELLLLALLLLFHPATSSAAGRWS